MLRKVADEEKFDHVDYDVSIAYFKVKRLKEKNAELCMKRLSRGRGAILVSVKFGFSLIIDYRSNYLVCL